MPRKRYFTKFQSVGPGTQDDYTVASGTTTETNKVMIDGVNWDFFSLGANTAFAPTMGSAASGTKSGLEIGLTDTNAIGWILTPYAHHQNSPLAAIIGTTPAFFVRMKVQMSDVSGLTLCHIGFHGTATATNPLQAHTVTFADYTDKATIGPVGADIKIITALNNASDTTTDTTQDATDALTLDMKVLVSAAGVVTYQHDLVTAGTLAAPTTTAAFTFDDTDVVVPCFWFQNASDVCDSLILREFEWGWQ